MIRFPITRWCWGAWTAIALHFLLVLLLGLSRHWGFMSSINDIGVFDQATWGTLHGQLLLNTSIFDQPINWLGFHFHPVILLFAPLYAIAPHPEWFTLTQALALSMAAWPIFRLTSHVFQSEKNGLLWALTYLVNPFLLNAAAWDFHPVTLAVPFVALALLAVEKGDSRQLFLSCLPLLFIQEHLGLTVTGFGLLWRLRNKTWEPAIWLSLLGVAHAAIVLGFIMPVFSPTGSHVMLTSDLGHLSRYGWLGKSAGDIALNLLRHPWTVAQTALLDWGGWFYLVLLILPFLGFPLVAPAFLLPAMPDLGANLLSAHPMPKSVFAYHSALLVPALTTAAAYGVRRISSWWPWLSSTQISGLALIVSLAFGYVLAPLPIPGAINFWAPAHFLNEPDPALVSIRAIIGTASISAQGNIGAHFSQRSQIYPYPRKLEDVDMIVLRLASPTSRTSPKDSGSVTALAWHLQMPAADYLASISCLLDDKEYYPVLWNDPWLVLRRGGANPTADSSLDGRIRQKLQQLQVDWRVEAKEYQETLQKCGAQKVP